MYRDQIFSHTINLYNKKFDWLFIVDPIWLVWNTYISHWLTDSLTHSLTHPSTHNILDAPTKRYFFYKKVTQKFIHQLSAMFTCRDGKGGQLSSQASKMLYKPPGAVYIASYKERLDQSDCWKLFVQLCNYTKYFSKYFSYLVVLVCWFVTVWCLVVESTS